MSTQFNFFAKSPYPAFRDRTNHDSGNFSGASSTTGSTESLNEDIKLETEVVIEEDYQLSSKWNVFYLRNDTTNWEDRVCYVYSFSTVKQFWALYQYLKLPSFLPQGCDYMVFRDGIKPEWTDVANVNGGRWLLEVDRQYRNEQLNSKWLETLLAIIGETLESDKNKSQICGAIVQSRRRVDRVGVWTADADDEEAVRSIGEKYRELLQPSLFQRLKYQSHKSGQLRQSSQLDHQIVI